jgi:2-iminobutanoate/2-iminopropanoate deaminase
MMDKKIIVTDKAPKAIGPYSQGVSAGCFVFTAGQIGLDPATGNLVEGGIEAETRQVLTNIKNILAAEGYGLEHVVKTTIFLKELTDFSAMNAVYGEFFKENPPARATVQVAGLPKNAKLQIDAIALNPDH